MAKSEWIEAEERGWTEIDKNVCERCVEDEFLRNQIRSALSVKKCDYCGCKSRKPIAAPVQVVLDPIVRTVAYYFTEPTSAGVPYEGGWLVNPTDTDDVLYSVGLRCHDELFEDIVYAFTNDAWVPAAGGHWASLHLNEVLEDSWYRFTE